jgi:DNA (cytosine-5)-methyltransferase 1
MALKHKADTYRMIDLFAGAGGMSLGFRQHFRTRIEHVWALDSDPDCVDTYNANFGRHCLRANIVDILAESPHRVPKADIVIGGPPCQGFSLLNKNRLDDARNQMWYPFMEVVRRSGASLFVIENVIQILGSFEHGEIVGAAETMGFQVWSGKLCAADYGVPQTRWRAFIVGCRFADPSGTFPPPQTHRDPRGIAKVGKDKAGARRLPWRTVRDAIGDLPSPVGTEIRGPSPCLSLHFRRNPSALSLERYRAVPLEGMNRFDLQRRAPHLTPPCWKKKRAGGTDLFGRLWWDRPAYTIRTEFYKPEKGRYLHPSELRAITHREAARFQTFPDAFVFSGSKDSVARQIGNAVPPMLAAHVAKTVDNLFRLAPTHCSK